MLVVCIPFVAKATQKPTEVKSIYRPVFKFSLEKLLGSLVTLFKLSAGILSGTVCERLRALLLIENGTHPWYNTATTQNVSFFFS